MRYAAGQDGVAALAMGALGSATAVPDPLLRARPSIAPRYRAEGATLAAAVRLWPETASAARPSRRGSLDTTAGIARLAATR